MIRTLLCAAFVALLTTTAAMPREVVIQGEAGPLTGTLLIPETARLPPAVILISGSGAQDRDGTIRGQKPFRRLASHLEGQGIATLRYDDRGIGGSAGNPDATLAEEAADLAHAIGFLCKVPEIDRARIGVLGHSAGGPIAALAAEARLPAFTILLAAPAVPGPDLLRAQIADKLRANRAPEARITANDKLVASMIEATMAGDAALRAEATRIAEGLGGDATWAQSQTAFFGSRLIRSFLNHDPASYEVLTTPVLALFGSADRQVDAAANASALARRDLPAVTTGVLADHNHLFQRTASGSPLSASGPAPSDETLERIARWIAATPAHPICEAPS